MSDFLWKVAGDIGENVCCSKFPSDEKIQKNASYQSFTTAV